MYLDFDDTINQQGLDVVRERYGNLFDMYQRITGEDAYRAPMRIYPAPHYTMGGLWVDYNLMSTIPGLFVIGEANFADHGANRLGASSLMQGLADGYFILPYTIGHYLATAKLTASAKITGISSGASARDESGSAVSCIQKGAERLPHFTEKSVSCCGITVACPAMRKGSNQR